MRIVPGETLEENEEFELWLKSDNVIKIGENLYLEQTTGFGIQFKRHEIKHFFYREYINI